MTNPPLIFINREICLCRIKSIQLYNSFELVISMNSVFDAIFGSWENAVWFIVIFFTVLFVITYFRRVYGLMALFSVLMFFTLYEEVITPAVLDWLCGDPSMNDLYYIFSLHIATTIDPTSGWYFYIQMYKPLGDYRGFYNLIMAFIGLFLSIIIIAKVAKRFFKKDEPYRSQKKN